MIWESLNVENSLWQQRKIWNSLVRKEVEVQNIQCLSDTVILISSFTEEIFPKHISTFIYLLTRDWNLYRKKERKKRKREKEKKKTLHLTKSYVLGLIHRYFMCSFYLTLLYFYREKTWGFGKWIMSPN